MPTTEELDDRLTRFEVRHNEFLDRIAEAIEAMEVKLIAVSDQNLRLAEMVQVQGSFTNAAIDGLQHHVSDGHGGQG